MSQEKSQAKDNKVSQKSVQNDDYIPKPDRSKFLEELNALRGKLDKAKAELAKHRQAIDSQSANGTQSPEETKLREEHSAVVNERNKLKDAERKITAEANRIEESVKRKVAELQNLRPKNGPRSVKELDAKVSQLEATMDSGTLSIVEEQKVLREVSALKKQRASFGQADKLQEEIDEVRKKAADLRKTIDQAAIRKVSARKAELEKQLDTFKQERQERRAKMNTVYDARRKAQAEIKEINNSMDNLRKDFDKRMEEFNAKLKARKEQREIEEKKAKEERAHQKKISDAKTKLESAHEPAFKHHIEQAIGLLRYFDPGYYTDPKPPAIGSNNTVEKKPKSSVSKAIKAPSAPEQAETVTPQQSTQQAPPSRKSQKLKAKESGNNKLNFDFGVIEALSALNISLPTTTEEIETTKEKIKEKIAYYKEHNERVTKERVERAEAELNHLLEELKHVGGEHENSETKA